MNIDLANKSIKNEADKYSKIKNIFTKLRDAESLNSKQRIEYFENLFEIKEYENKDLKKIFDSFREGMKNLESKRDKHLKIISELILPVADMYPTIIKGQKNNLDDLARKRKNNPQVSQSRSIIEKREKENVKSYKDFQTNSINDSKYILMNYIHSELKYHAALMEELNSLFFKINDIEPLVHLKKFGESYGINDYDISKLKLENVDKKKIEEYEKNRKENEDEEKIGVYSSGEESDEEITTSVKKSKVKNSSIKKSKNKKNNKSKNTKINSEDNEEIKESATSDKKIDED